jgi:predicted PurR-regulated permease PerM
MKDAQNFSITSGTIIRAILIGVLFWGIWFLKDIVLIVLAAIVLASSLEPSIQFLVKNKVPRVLSLIGVYLASMGGFIVMLYFFIPAFLVDMSLLLKALPEEYNIVGMVFGAENSANLGVALEKGVSLIDFFAKNISSLGIADFIWQIFGGFASFILIIVLAFYLSATEHGIESFLRIVTPSRQAGYVVGLWYRSQRKIGKWFQGQMLLGLLIGVITFICLLILGVKSAFFLAAIMIVFEIIPVFGPILAAIPGITIAYTSGINIAPDGGFTAMLIVVGMYVLIQQIESHIIYPLVVRKVIGISPVIVILSLIIGLKLAGFLGALLAVPVATTLMEYLNDVSYEKKNKVPIIE